MLTDGSERGTKVDRGCSLADPTFLVGNPEDPRPRGIWFDGRFAESNDLRVGGLI
jgi:hypothetical protein